MKIKLLHGRKAHDYQMKEWGFDGPTLEGVEFVHHAYGLQKVTVGFRSLPEAVVAFSLTGWEFFDETVLEMDFLSDMVVCGGNFYGDYEIQDDDEMPEDSILRIIYDRLRRALGAKKPRP